MTNLTPIEASKPRTRKTHMCINLRGVLRNFKAREWRNCCKDDTGRTMTPDEVREHFMDELAKGHKVVPINGPCEGFSYETGCPGHWSDES